MINLKNGYVITSDGKSYTLSQYVLQESKAVQQQKKELGWI